MRSLAGAVLAVFSLLWVSTAQADIPPPDDFVETCTKTVYEVAGTDCEPCSNGHMSDTDPCIDLYGDSDRVKVCNTYGASFWTELWCASDGTRSSEEIDAERTSNVATVRAGGDIGDSTGGGSDRDEDACQIGPFTPVPAGALVLGMLVVVAALTVRRRSR